MASHGNGRRVWWASFAIDFMQSGALVKSLAATDAYSAKYGGYASMADDFQMVPWATRGL